MRISDWSSDVCSSDLLRDNIARCAIGVCVRAGTQGIEEDIEHRIVNRQWKNHRASRPVSPVVRIFQIVRDRPPITEFMIDFEADRGRLAVRKLARIPALFWRTDVGIEAMPARFGRQGREGVAELGNRFRIVEIARRDELEKAVSIVQILAIELHGAAAIIPQEVGLDLAAAIQRIAWIARARAVAIEAADAVIECVGELTGGKGIDAVIGVFAIALETEAATD